MRKILTLNSYKIFNLMNKLSIFLLILTMFECIPASKNKIKKGN